jgi:hypothetical protein
MVTNLYKAGAPYLRTALRATSYLTTRDMGCVTQTGSEFDMPASAPGSKDSLAIIAANWYSLVFIRSGRDPAAGA